MGQIKDASSELDRRRRALLQRLTRARGERSIHQVQQALKEAGVPGTSYPTVHAIFNGKTEPGLAFLTEFANYVDRSPSWLAFGEGRETRGGKAVTELVAAVWRQMEEELPLFGAMPPVVQAAFFELIQRIWMARVGGPKEEQNASLNLARPVWRLLFVAWVECARDAPADLGRAFTDYAVAMCHAMALAVPLPRPKTRRALVRSKRQPASPKAKARLNAGVAAALTELFQENERIIFEQREEKNP